MPLIIRLFGVIFVRLLLHLTSPPPLIILIATRLTVGIAVAIPAASLCINRRLYKIATVQIVALSPGQARFLLVRPSCMLPELWSRNIAIYWSIYR
jgi:hypothetical protein